MAKGRMDGRGREWGQVERVRDERVRNRLQRIFKDRKIIKRITGQKFNGFYCSIDE